MVQKIIIICGPTAAQKTRLGIELARKFNGEIVSADSGQVWRGFDIGTAKPSLVARRSSLAAIPHYLIDVANPGEHFDAARFVGLADAALEDIVKRGKVPFVVGGTGMYIRMLVHGICEAPPRDEDFRKEVEGEIEKSGIAALHERLRKIDPETAGELHPNDRARIIRALEIHYLTGIPASQIRKGHKFKECRYNALKIGLSLDRSELYRRIDARADEMIASGLVDEVRGLLGRYDENCQPFNAVGYREIVDYLKGRIGLDGAVSFIKQNSRRYAKRQLTWFRADPEIEWFTPEEIERISKTVLEFLRC